ncbi:MAG: protein-L-isoaspartate O-methyltransferase [Candidatus Pacebacteria bacterium]|nr:protein-L-isoaspartate O-methyltransferase [Candidatus Paceibacterota bacterium]
MNKKELIFFLTRNNILKTKSIIQAFEKIDRKDFILKKYTNEVYNDYPLDIGFNQTISQPSTVAFMLELLSPKKGDKILDVGSGSGWTTTLLGYIVGGEGKVCGVELIPDLVLFGRANLEKYDFKNVKIYQATKDLGLKDKGPFDKILVSASARDVPEELVNQLKVGGTMVIPIQDSIFRIFKKSRKQIEKEKIPGFIFVPLIY